MNAVWLLFASEMLVRLSLGVVGVVGDVARRVGDAGQPVGVVIRVRGGLAVLVGSSGSRSDKSVTRA